MKDNIKEIIKNMDIGGPEHEYILYCLGAAVNYCHEQFKNSGKDCMPSAGIIELQNEEDKFELLKAYLQTLEV